MAAKETLKAYSPLSRLLVLLSGVWLLLRQAFQGILESSSVADGAALVICSLFVLCFALGLTSFALRRMILASIVLTVGHFVLLLSADAPEFVMWLESVRLFVARISPLVGLVAIVLAWRPGMRAEVMLSPVRWWMSLPRAKYVLGASLLAFLSTFLMARFAYTCMPRSYDGIANIFQARIFASGRLTLPSPPHPTAFLHFGLIQEPAWCSYYPPGYSAVLAIGLLLGSVCLVNPILTALTVPALERIAFRRFGKPAAALTVLMFALSPFVPIVGASFRNHALALFLLAWSTAMLLDPTRKRRRLVLSGVLGSAALLARPYTAFLWGAGLFVGVALDRRREFWHMLCPFVLGAIPGLTIAVLYNLMQTGGSLDPPPVYLYGKEFGLGFGQRVMGDHTLLRAISFTTTRIEGLGRMVLGWPFPVVLLPIAVAFLGGWRSMMKIRLWVMVLPPLFLLLGYARFWFLEFSHGPRFLYSALITLLPMTAHSMLVLPRKIENILPPGLRRSAGPMLTGAVLLSIFYSLLVTWPHAIRIFGDNYGCQVDLPDLAKTLPPGEKLIFFAPITSQISDYGWGFLMNDLELDGEFVVAFDYGEKQNAEVMALFPNRQVYYYSYDLGKRKGSIRPISQASILPRGKGQ